MAVIAEVILRGITRVQYDAVRAETGWLEQSPTGGLAHLTWWDGADCHNVDGWSDEAAFAAFAEQRLGPAMAAVGVAVEPEVTFRPAHEVFTPHRGVVAATAVPATNVERIRGAYAAFAAGDTSAVLAAFDPEIVWTSPDSIRNGGRRTGPEGVAAFFATLSQDFAELSVRPDTYVDGGDTVAVLGSHGGRTAAGTPFDIPFVHVWTLRDGNVTAFTEYFDTAPLLADLAARATTTV